MASKGFEIEDMPKELLGHVGRHFIMTPLQGNICLHKCGQSTGGRNGSGRCWDLATHVSGLRDLFNFALVNRKFHQAVKPLLFCALRVRSTRAGRAAEYDVPCGSCVDWSEIKETISEMLSPGFSLKQGAADAVKYLALDFPRGIHPSNANGAQRLSVQCIDLLTSLSNLETLIFCMPSAGNARQIFSDAFHDAGSALTLPNVTKLAVGLGSDFIIHHCPNAKRIESYASFSFACLCTKYHGGVQSAINNIYNLIVAAGTAQKLEHFELYLGHTYNWEEMPKDIAAAKGLHNVKVLGLAGPGFEDELELDEWQSILLLFQHLETLIIPSGLVHRFLGSNAHPLTLHTQEFDLDTADDMVADVREETAAAYKNLVATMLSYAPTLKEVWLEVTPRIEMEHGARGLQAWNGHLFEIKDNLLREPKKRLLRDRFSEGLMGWEIAPQDW